MINLLSMCLLEKYYHNFDLMIFYLRVNLEYPLILTHKVDTDIKRFWLHFLEQKCCFLLTISCIIVIM